MAQASCAGRVLQRGWRPRLLRLLRLQLLQWHKQAQTAQWTCRLHAVVRHAGWPRPKQRSILNHLQQQNNQHASSTSTDLGLGRTLKEHLLVLAAAPCWPANSC